MGSPAGGISGHWSAAKSLVHWSAAKSLVRNLGQQREGGWQARGLRQGLLFTVMWSAARGAPTWLFPFPSC